MEEGRGSQADKTVESLYGTQASSLFFLFFFFFAVFLSGEGGRANGWQFAGYSVQFATRQVCGQAVRLGQPLRTAWGSGTLLRSSSNNPTYVGGRGGAKAKANVNAKVNANVIIGRVE